MKTLYLVLLLALPALRPWLVQAQPAGPAADLSAAVQAARQQHDAAFATSPQLINGPEYVDYAKRYAERRGHQFFLSAERQPGRVYCNGYLFDKLQLAYDLVLDQVVLPQPTSPLQLRLVNEDVRWFELAGHRFVRLQADSAAGSVIKTGYYEVLTDSAVQVLAKRSKQLQEQVEQRVVRANFLTRDRLFVRKNGMYYQVARKKDLLPLLADQQAAVQQYLQQQRLKFNRGQLEASTVRLVRFYNRLP
jgi:hypothetical protein